MSRAAPVTYLRIECPTCRKRFVPNPVQVRRELLIVCPHCLSPYVPARVPRLQYA